MAQQKLYLLHNDSAPGMATAVNQAKIIECSTLVKKHLMRVIRAQISRWIEIALDVPGLSTGHVVLDVVFVRPRHRGAGCHGQRRGVEAARGNPHVVRAAHSRLQRVFAAVPLRQRERRE